MHRKGKSRRPYDFSDKVSFATTLKHCKSGPFVTHVKALRGNPASHTANSNP